jgi:predicted LPLAT superfamily acyltransferase
MPVNKTHACRGHMSEQWRNKSERGSRGLKRLIIWLALHCGRAFCRALLIPICAYFILTAPRARRSSLAFLSRALGRPAAWSDTFRHLLIFSTTLLDRVYLLNGRQRELTVDVNNEALFWQTLAQGRGCLLLGSHLGSFEMLGIIGSVEKKLVINVVMHVADSEGLSGLISTPGHTLPYHVIPLGHPGSMLQVKECLARGEVVGILADRIYGDERTQTLSFLGHPARFTLSPLRLAKITDAPILMMFGLFHGKRHYEIVFEPMVEHSLPCYVESLERKARQFPFNWFNFYDYWSA